MLHSLNIQPLIFYTYDFHMFYKLLARVNVYNYLNNVLALNHLYFNSFLVMKLKFLLDSNNNAYLGCVECFIVWLIISELAKFSTFCMSSSGRKLHFYCWINLNHCNAW